MAFAVTGTNFNVRTIPESWIFLQDVSTVEFGTHFCTENTIPNLVAKNNPAVIIKNDCVLVTGNSLLQTFDYLEVAEFSAKSLVLCASIGNLVPISNEQVEELREAFIK
jgi:L-fuculose-phosphate aldolase